MRNFNIILLYTLAIIFSSCVKEIKVELPDYESKLVVEGIIETGLPPYVILTKSVPYFDPVDEETLSNLYVKDAIVKVSDGTKEVKLESLCSDDLTDAQKIIIAQFLNIKTSEIEILNLCIYIPLSQSLIGKANNTYDLTIEYEGHVYTSSTYLPEPIPLDSTWFQVFEGETELGYLWANLSDPAGETNYYRWQAQRINSYPNGGGIKDSRYIAPLGSAFDDKFFDGQSFEFNVYRGEIANSGKEDDHGKESGFFKTGDTVAVKFSTIDRNAFKFLSVMEDQLATEGSPFASPSTIPSNIEGENVLGLWAAYSPTYDTVYCK